MAKGAILSGFLALLELTGLDMEQLDEVIIAGQFGAHLSTESLVGIGLVPEKLKDKVRYVGNSAITGALMCLLSMDIRDELKDVAGQINYFELSTMDGYESLFTKCLSF